jgi:hypothetical protein
MRLVYHWYLDIVTRDRDFFKWIDPDDIPADTAAIHGHYMLSQFEDQFENPFTSVVLREPLDRMVSQYLHWCRAGGNVGWRIDIPYDKNMTFEEYAFRQEFNNFQTKLLDRKSLHEYDLVGVTQGIDRFVARLRGEPDEEMEEIADVHGVANKPKYIELGLNEALIERFTHCNAEDYKNYHLAKKLAGISEKIALMP